MTPEQAAHARASARRDAELGLENLPSYEIGTNSPRAAGILLRLQTRLAEIDAAEARGNEQRRTDQAGQYRHGRAWSDGKPVPNSVRDEQQIATVMDEMAARGLGRI